MRKVVGRAQQSQPVPSGFVNSPSPAQPVATPGQVASGDELFDRLDSGQIDGQAFAGPFEVDDVEVLCPLLDELSRHGGRVIGERGQVLGEGRSTS